jgi:hypothetical protein
MAHTAVATLQATWDCRWSRPGHHITGVPEHHQPDTRWVCVRDGHRRHITTGDCESCPHWEMDEPEPVTDIAAAAAAAPTTILAPTLPRRLVYLLTWLLVISSAATLVAMGLAILTTPFALPVTVALWLSAAAIMGFACCGRLPEV